MTNSDKRWEKWLKELVEIVRRSRWNGRSQRGTDEDAIYSAIKSALSKAECPPVDDAAIFDFIKLQLNRKIDTYRHEYRTGDGRTRRLSDLAKDDDNPPFELMRRIQENAGGSELEYPPEGFEGPMTFDMIQDCITWIEREAARFPTQQMRDVFRLWLDGATIAETEKSLKISNFQVKETRREIKQFLRGRASE